jgi:CO dehydrogenase maturation factor
MCGAHATVRGFIGELVAQTARPHDIIVDMEAGLEHLSRGTGRHVSRFLTVVEPYFRSMETARRIAQLAAELGVQDVQAVTNKIRNEADRTAVAEFCAAHGISVIADIPYDDTLAEAERRAEAPIDFNPASPSAAAIAGLADRLLAAR